MMRSMHVQSNMEEALCLVTPAPPTPLGFLKSGVRDPQLLKYLLKKSSVRCQASLAAASS
jgi:hypothetical protein